MDSSDSHKISWNSQLERIISDEGERSLCYSWLHSKSEKWFAKLNTYLTLPVILMSTIAGAGSIGTQSLFNGAGAANVVIGCISLTVATLNTVGSYFSWAKRSESHRIAGTTYAKIYRFILIELALPRSERIAAKDMLKIVREQCDRLQETSPQIPDNIIGEFKLKFGTTTPDVKKPEITNGLDPILVHPSDMDSPHYKPPILSNEPLSIRISTSGHTLNKSQMSSLVHPLSEFASDNNHT
uniref:SMODS and SLOG-associating 2TM effector domain-containing protein n=1 Tax=viral metagenome TaxID=1070528 RepID=A0A6C0ENQ2_9ZZZZ